MITPDDWSWVFFSARAGHGAAWASSRLDTRTKSRKAHPFCGFCGLVMRFMVTMLQPCGIVCRRTHFIFRRGSCDLFACAVGQKRAVARGAARCHSAAATLPPRPLPLCVRRQPPAIAAAAAATGWGATPPPLATQPQRDIHCTPISASCTFLVVWPNLHTGGRRHPTPCCPASVLWWQQRLAAEWEVHVLPVPDCHAASEAFAPARASVPTIPRL